MPRKTKEINEEKPVKKESKLNKKIDNLIKAVFNSEEAVVDDKKTAKKAAKSAEAKKEKKTPKTSKAAETKKKSTTKSTKKDETETKKASTQKATAAKKVTTKKAATAKKAVSEKSTTVKKSTTKKATSSTKATAKTTTKKASKTASTKSTKTAKKSAAEATKSKTSKSKTTTKSIAKVAPPTIVEYYDLPYKYNQTVVKVLYQNPTTLFVYWEISDNDIENYKKQYGENFFDTTRPVLVVHNDTMNYSFEIDINDFANSWYFNINDSKCDYRVELIRRPVFYNEEIGSNHIFITSSNNIETPNDKILFSTDEPNVVYFRNTKNNTQRKVYLSSLLESLNLTNKNFGFPIVRNVYDLYKNIYNIEDVGEFSISLTNPSSGNPSSHSLTSRFI